MTAKTHRNNRAAMKPGEYDEILHILGWTRARAAEYHHVERRTVFRYIAGHSRIPISIAADLRRLARAKLTMSAKQFSQFVEE